MNGYGVFCSLYNNDGPTDTAMVFLYVSAYVVTTTSTGSYGYVPTALYAVDGKQNHMNDQSIRETNRSRSDPGFFFLISLQKIYYGKPILSFQ